MSASTSTVEDTPIIGLFRQIVLPVGVVLGFLACLGMLLFARNLMRRNRRLSRMQSLDDVTMPSKPPTFHLDVSTVAPQSASPWSILLV